MQTKKPSDDSRLLEDFVRELTAHQSRIRAFLITLMPGDPDVGDVLQETNIVLWNSRLRFQPGSNFLAWAITVARLEVLHHRRRAGRYQRLMISPELSDMMVSEFPLTNDHEAYLQALDSCMSKLPQKHRDLIDIRYKPGYSIEKCARETSRNATTLRITLMRVRMMLKECIDRKTKEHFA